MYKPPSKITIMHHLAQMAVNQIIYCCHEDVDICDIPWNTGSAGTLYTLISPLYLRALVRCDVVRCQGILV